MTMTQTTQIRSQSVREWARDLQAQGLRVPDGDVLDLLAEEWSAKDAMTERCDELQDDIDEQLSDHCKVLADVAEDLSQVIDTLTDLLSLEQLADFAGDMTKLAAALRADLLDPLVELHKSVEQ